MEEFLRAVKALNITVVQLWLIDPGTLSHYYGEMDLYKFTGQEGTMDK